MVYFASKCNTTNHQLWRNNAQLLQNNPIEKVQLPIYLLRLQTSSNFNCFYCVSPNIFCISTLLHFTHIFIAHLMFHFGNNSMNYLFGKNGPCPPQMVQHFLSKKAPCVPVFACILNALFRTLTSSPFKQYAKATSSSEWQHFRVFYVLAK